MENLIQRNAIAFQKLLHTEYYYCLSLAGKGIEVRLRFQEEGRNSDYYCRSFVANPSFDRKRGLKRMTLLWKEKTDLLTNMRTLQYNKDGFTPAQLRT